MNYQTQRRFSDDDTLTPAQHRRVLITKIISLALPLVIVWVVFMVGWLLEIFASFYWWTLPFILTSITLLVFSILFAVGVCDNEMPDWVYGIKKS